MFCALFAFSVRGDDDVCSDERVRVGWPPAAWPAEHAARPVVGMVARWALAGGCVYASVCMRIQVESPQQTGGQAAGLGRESVRRGDGLVTARAAIASGALLPDIGRTANDGRKQGRSDGSEGRAVGRSDRQTHWADLLLLKEREKGSKRRWTGGTRAVLGRPPGCARPDLRRGERDAGGGLGMARRERRPRRASAIWEPLSPPNLQRPPCNHAALHNNIPPSPSSLTLFGRRSSGLGASPAEGPVTLHCPFWELPDAFPASSARTVYQ